MAAPKKLMTPKDQTSGTKRVSASSKFGSKEKSPLMALGASGKKDYAKQPKSGATDLGIPSFGMTGMTGED